MSANSLLKQSIAKSANNQKNTTIFKQSGNAYVSGFADYYKDVIQDDTYNINNLDSLQDESVEFGSHD